MKTRYDGRNKIMPSADLRGALLTMSPDASSRSGPRNNSTAIGVRSIVLPQSTSPTARKPSSKSPRLHSNGTWYTSRNIVVSNFSTFESTGDRHTDFRYSSHASWCPRAQRYRCRQNRRNVGTPSSVSMAVTSYRTRSPLSTRRNVRSVSSVTLASFHPPSERNDVVRTAQFAPPYAGRRYSDCRPYSLTRYPQ